MSAFRDLTGRKFGRLTVIEFSHRNKYRHSMWNCRCDCGKETIVSSPNLRRGTSQSCGCLRSENISKIKTKDLINKRFGRLVVLRRSKYNPSTSHQVNWLCRCDCGNFTVVSSGCLQAVPSTQSCGCLRKERFTTHGLSHTPEYRNGVYKKRRDLKKLLDTEWGWELEVELRQFQPFCAVCGSVDSLSVDHVRPLSKGYGLKPGNAVVLCKSHNSSKNAKDLAELPVEWRTKILTAAKAFEDYWNTTHG